MGVWLPGDVAARARLSMRTWRAPIRSRLRFLDTRRWNLPRKVFEAATFVKLCVVEFFNYSSRAVLVFAL